MINLQSGNNTVYLQELLRIFFKKLIGVQFFGQEEPEIKI